MVPADGQGQPGRGGGGICFDSTSLIVDGTAAPFAVTYPTATGVVWYINDFKTITWNASTTAGMPINCANVTIQLSTDRGLTYPITLLASTPNDGSQEIQVPNNAGTTCRVRVLALGNVFYDISNSNFIIQASPSASYVFNQPDPVITCNAATATATLKTGALGGFSNSISLTTSSAPAGVTVSYSSNPIAAGSSATVTFNGVNTLTAGTYNIVIGGTAAGTSAQLVTITLVAGAPQAPPILTAPAAYAVGVSTQPTFTWPAVASATGYVLEVAALADFSSTVFTTTTPATSFTLTTPLADNMTYFWRVKTTSICGTSAPGVASVFRTLQNGCNAAFAQDFVSTTFPPANLTIYNPNNNATWTRSAAGNGTVGSAFFNNYDNNLPGQIDDLRMQPYTPGSGTDSIIISFDLAAKYYNASSYDTLKVLVSANNGTTFTTLYSKFGLALATAGSSTDFYISAETTDWRRERIALSKTLYTGTPLLFAIRNINKYGNNIFIDNITVCEPVKTPITYTFSGNGAWSNAANWNNKAIPPAILPANIEIIINPAADGQCVLDITQRISTGAKLTVKSGKMIKVPGAVIIQ